MQTKIAAQVYDFVDAHIRHLDEDLRSFEDEINGDRNELNLADDETACGKLGWDDGAPVVAAPAQPEQRQKRKYRKKGTTAAESVEASGMGYAAQQHGCLAASAAATAWV